MQNYLCNQCLSPLSVWVRISLMVYSIQHYVIKFVRYLRQVGGFLRVLRFPPPIKLLDCHDVTDILLKVALHTLTHNQKDEHAPKIHLRSDNLTLSEGAVFITRADMLFVFIQNKKIRFYCYMKNIKKNSSNLPKIFLFFFYVKLFNRGKLKKNIPPFPLKVCIILIVVPLWITMYFSNL